MKTLFSGEMWVEYAQFYVMTDPDSYDLPSDAAFAGQEQGLCGAAVDGVLCLVTGLHTGHIPLTVELHGQRPPVGPEWEEVVEASLVPVSDLLQLHECDDQVDAGPGFAGMPHRVRYAALAMDEGHEADTRSRGEPCAERYLLQLWPAAPAPDRLIRETSPTAAYWNGVARDRPPPPTPEERAAAERAEREAREREEVRREAEFERLRWGGRVPSGRLRDVGGHIAGLLKRDAPLVHLVGAADDVLLRDLALFLARRVYDAAGLGELEWTAPAIGALEAGRPPPEPWGDPQRVWLELARLEPRMGDRLIAWEDGTRRVSQRHMALPVLWSAAAPDPLRAALESLWHSMAAFGTGTPGLLAEVRAILAAEGVHPPATGR
ncbi:hypothetical protein [Streptomyces sp. NPDC050560]|uniref:hypothetical protein n=1 Tax=Streptomyces sp. NPDC050560 TaxID=3365630 RepID=UPI0037A4853F